MLTCSSHTSRNPRCLAQFLLPPIPSASGRPTGVIGRRSDRPWPGRTLECLKNWKWFCFILFRCLYFFYFMGHVMFHVSWCFMFHGLLTTGSWNFDRNGPVTPFPSDRHPKLCMSIYYINRTIQVYENSWSAVSSHTPQNKEEMVYRDNSAPCKTLMFLLMALS